MTCRLPFLNPRRRWGSLALLFLQFPLPLGVWAQEGRINEPTAAYGNYQPQVRVANSLPQPNQLPTQNQPYAQPYQAAAMQPATPTPTAVPLNTALPSQTMMMVQPNFAPGNYPPGTQFMLVPVAVNGMNVSTIQQATVPQVIVSPTTLPQTVPNLVPATPTTTKAIPNSSFQPQLSPQQLQGLSQQVGRITAQGFQLAERGALFAARQKFEEALQLAAQGVDGQMGTNEHSHALAAALSAFKEAEDFAPNGDATLVDRDVSRIVATHRTDVLKDATPGMPPVAALQAYFRFGRQQTVAATGMVPAASDALHGLGKVHSFLAREESESNELHIARAIACHQAALDINPQQARAANELGVLFAQHGQWQDAKQALVHSLRTQPRPEVWQNLAVVHQRLGENDLAQRAQWEHSRMIGASNGNTGGNSQGVQWVEPEQFARQSPHPNAPGQQFGIPGGNQVPRPGPSPTAGYPVPTGVHYR